MASGDASRIFLDVLVDRCRFLASELDSLLARDYPSAAPNVLGNCLRKACQELLTRAKNLREAGQQIDRIPNDEIMLEASNIYDFVDSATTVLCPILRASSTAEVPSELVLPMERMARLMFPGSQVIVEATPEINYYFKELASNVRNLFSSLELDDILTQLAFPDELFRLQLCSNPPNGILTHCLLGHEIGHAVYEKKEADKTLLPLLRFDEEAIRRFVDSRLGQMREQISVEPREAPMQLALEETRDFLQYMLKTEIGIIAARWVREIFCDIVGVGLLGPAFICSAGIFMLAFEDIDHPTLTHPPSRLRIQLALRALERDDPGFGYRRLLSGPSSDAVRSVTYPWKESVGTNVVRPTGVQQRVVFDAVYRLGDDIIRQAKRCLQGSFLYPGWFNREVPMLRNRIRGGLPPNEFKPSAGEKFNIATLQGIFNAGWLCYMNDLSHFGSLHADLTEEEVKSRFYGLIAKGMESSEIQKRWSEFQQGAGQ